MSDFELHSKRGPRPIAGVVLISVMGACGGIARVQGYVDELERCRVSSSGSGDSGTSEGSGPCASGGSGDSTGTTVAPETTGTGSGADSSSGAAQSSGGTTGSTGEPMAECGDGVLEAFGSEPEECDDGNLDPLDGCDETCAREVRVFVTSVVYQAGELGGLYLADALCFNLADDQGFADPLTYRAWLSDGETDARDRFKRGRGRLVMVNGLVLADSWSGLLAGALKNPFEVTEESETYDGPVWTGTRPDGTAVPGAQHCDDWTTTSIQKTGHYGYSDRTTPEWTLSELWDNPIDCAAAHALYCLQSL